MPQDIQAGSKDRVVPLALNDGRVTASFRDALFDVTDREGVSVNEFIIRAAAEKLHAAGRDISGVFRPGDFEFSSEIHR